MKRIILYTLLFSLFTISICYGGETFKFDPSMTADRVWANVDASLSGLRDYTSDFNLDGTSRDLHLTLSGKLACILPNRLKVVFEGLPSFLGSHKEMVSNQSLQDIIDRKKFSHTIAMTEVLAGEPYYVIKSVALEKGNNLQEARFWIHAQKFTSNKIILKYSSGGYVRATQKFTPVKGYMLPNYQDISIAFPEWRAEILVSYGNFLINTGVKF